MPATAFGGFVDLQEILGKSIAWPEECHLCAKVAARELGRAGCQGIIKMGQMVLTMWMESSDLAPSCTCRLLGVSTQQRKKGACQHFHPLPWSCPVWLLPHIFLVLFELLPCAGAPAEWLCKQMSLCTGHQDLQCLSLYQPIVFLRHKPCWFSQPDVMETSPPDTGALRCLGGTYAWGDLHIHNILPYS